ncbi:MAG: dienelactone hydrolase family protein [Planctomycetes bacterium]|nr:dienelactone hydrolase family protein [Planctomycetota bacterium]
MRSRSLLRTIFGVLLLTLPALAGVQTKALEYEHAGTKLVGFLAWDDAKATEKTPQPAVVVCPEWWGCNEYAHERAKKLAELGYVALAIDVYGAGKTTKDPKEATAWSGEVYGNPELGRGRARAGYDALLRQPQVDKTRVAAIGYCMGGTVALELARTGADLRAIVAFHTSKLTSLVKPEDNAKITAMITVCHGQDDAFVNPDEITGFHAEMKAAKRTYQFLSYSGAVHSFTNKSADSFGIPGVAYDATADALSWEHMRAAFALAFVKGAKR